MKTIVLYDSTFGNTQMIAETIAKELGKNVEILPVAKFKKSDWKKVEKLVIGSPIIGWRPSERMGNFLASLGKNELKGVKAAAFDTRVKLFIHGDAAGQISGVLERAGATIMSEPMAFFVKGKEGPLYDGELEKAKEWGKLLSKQK